MLLLVEAEDALETASPSSSSAALSTTVLLSWWGTRVASPFIAGKKASCLFLVMGSILVVAETAGVGGRDEIIVARQHPRL